MQTSNNQTPIAIAIDTLINATRSFNTISIDHTFHNNAYDKDITKYNKQLFKTLAICMRDEPSRFQMSGIGYNDEKKELIATDTTRLLVIKSFNIELPKDKENQTVIFNIDNVKNKSFLSGYVEGVFPNYSKAVPDCEYEIDNKDLSFKNVERFTMSIENAVIKQQQINNDKMQSQLDHKSLKMNLNESLLKDYFEIIKTAGIVKVFFTSSRRPVVIECNQQDCYSSTFLLMPILGRD